jgi:chromosome partitioning protein
VKYSGGLADLGQRVLLVDLDQQASATRYVGVDPEQVNPTFYHVFMKQTPASLVRRQTAFGFDLLPSSSLLAAIEESLEPGDEQMLRDILAPLQEEYDAIVIDTPPGKAGLAFNGIVAADLLLVPDSAERMAIDVVSDLINHVQEIFWHKYGRHWPSRKFAFSSRCTRRTRPTHPGGCKPTGAFTRECAADAGAGDGGLPRSFDRRLPITVMEPDHPGAVAYRQLAEWIVDHAHAET